MLVTGDFISADEARDKGLVNRVVDAAELDAEVATLVAAHRGQATRRDRDGQGAVLSAARSGHRQLRTPTRARRWPSNMMDACALDGVQARCRRTKTQGQLSAFTMRG